MENKGWVLLQCIGVIDKEKSWNNVRCIIFENEKDRAVRCGSVCQYTYFSIYS
jgi:hypothetical protein